MAKSIVNRSGSGSTSSGGRTHRAEPVSGRSGRVGGGKRFGGTPPKKTTAPVAGKTSAPPVNTGLLPGNLQRSSQQSNVSNGGPYMGSVDPIGGSPFGGGAPVVSGPSEEDYLSGDSGYQTQLSALQGALQRYLADSDFQKTNYETDYGRSLRDLGYDEGAKEWNWNDQLTASGKGYQNQLDDFGSRGMLQSSGYANAFQELQRMLGQQYDAMAGAKNTFMTDLGNQTANFKAENTANQQAARAEALQRRAAQFAL